MPNYNQVISLPNPVSGGTPQIVSRRSKVQVQTNTPNYGRVVKLGQRLPENGYSLTVIKQTTPWARSRRYYNNGGTAKTEVPTTDAGYHPNDFYGNLTITGDCSSFAALDAKALKSLYQRSKYYQTNVGVMAAEAGRTLNLVTSTATRLAGVYSDLRKFKFGSALSRLGLHTKSRERDLYRRSRAFVHDKTGYASKAFLEYSYGWVPLLNDVYSSAEDLAKSNLTRSEDVIIRGSSSDTGTWDYVYNNPMSASPNQYFGVGKIAVSTLGPNDVFRSVSYKLALRLASQSLRTRSNLGLTNPLSVAWELLPSSFVVDWFMPIGEYIESLSAFQGLLFVDGSRSQFYKSRQSVLFTGRGHYSSSGFRMECGGGIRYQTENVTLTRAKLSGIPAWRTEKWLTPLGLAVSDRPLKALALLRAAFR